MAIDLAALVNDSHLDLDVVFAGASWRTVDTAATFVACCFGLDGDQPGEVELKLERAEMGGIEAWRWREPESGDHGDVCLSRDDAVAAAEEYAQDSDETPDVDEQISAIIETGYFGADVDADDIREICEALCGHSQGVLLLPSGEVPARPLGRLWTTNGYLQCDHIQVAATHSSVELAAAALLAACTEDTTEHP